MPKKASVMTKTQVAAELATILDIPKKAASLIFEEITTMAIRETKKNGVFQLPGIGKLTKAQRKERMGRNPATGEAIKIAAKTVVKMRLSKAFKEAVVK